MNEIITYFWNQQDKLASAVYVDLTKVQLSNENFVAQKIKLFVY